jgi:hypothetical protein
MVSEAVLIATLLLAALLLSSGLPKLIDPQRRSPRRCRWPSNVPQRVAPWVSPSASPAPRWRWLRLVREFLAESPGC